MALYLVQHGKSRPKETDPTQGLSPEGAAEVRRIAEVALGYNVRVSEIFHSIKKRARETAEIFSEYLKPAGGVSEKTGLKPMDDPSAWAENLNTADDRMLVGHLPFMEKITSLLITGDADRPVFRFQNGGIVCMDHYPGTDLWIIRWTLMPRIGGHA